MVTLIRSEMCDIFPNFLNLGLGFGVKKIGQTVRNLQQLSNKDQSCSYCILFWPNLQNCCNLVVTGQTITEFTKVTTILQHFANIAAKHVS